MSKLLHKWVLWSNFDVLLHPGFAINQKMILVKCILRQKNYLMLRLQADLWLWPKIWGALTYSSPFYCSSTYLEGLFFVRKMALITPFSILNIGPKGSWPVSSLPVDLFVRGSKRFKVVKCIKVKQLGASHILLLDAYIRINRMPALLQITGQMYLFR